MDNYCAYCSIVLSSEAEFQAHCSSESHQLMIMSDEGREWKFRPPARGVPSDQYSLCTMFSFSGKCRLGQQCCDAHGHEELNEWKERYEYRQKKLQHAKDCQMQGNSYMEQLMEKWLTTSNPLNIMKENLEDVEVVIEPENNLTVSEKNCCREWTIQLSTKAVLRHIALLYETHRSHFRLSHLTFEQSPGIVQKFDVGTNCQEWTCCGIEENSTQNIVYTCKVRFVASIYGTFRQAVVFDFGFEPVLLQKLSVDVVSISDLEKLQQARENVVSFTERWSSDDVVIVPFENRPYSIGENEKNLLACYPPPEASKFTLTQAVMEPTLTKDNYGPRLHELLCIEEIAQYELLSRYNVKAHLNLTSCYLLTPNSAVTAKYAHNGELFANMKLSSVLSEDSSSGRLILTNCSTVLIAPIRTKGTQHRKVYEGVIEDKVKSAIYIRLSKQCTEDLNLQPDREFAAEVQFQLNRLPLCEMHFAVDRLHPPSLVFPDILSLPSILWNSNSWLDKLDLRLNHKQREAVYAICAPTSKRLPPVLIIGPFGTGKTFTLAQAVKLLLTDPNARVLVCTHSNSAADIYIREYLHPQVAEGCVEATPLRIYYRHRWVATVHSTVLQYCLVSYTDSDRTFNMPTIEDVEKHKVVVTTLSTSRYLVQLGLKKGFFTHILIDEAAQAMECEAIMPLSLASENTRIVLAGDHMQLNPEVYSQFAQERNLHTSLLERLYDLYPEDFVCKILLCENYRSHEAIIQYTSELFYENHLIASAQQPQHEKYYPLTFFTARGEDVQDVNSTAYHNNAEVYEIVERVIELKRSWPDDWGTQDENSIGVVTPYYDQVVRIRAELRKKKLHGVSVERVLNVQGKQFRVIFLSSVRTRQTCNGPKLQSESDLDHGFLSNARLLNTAITRAQSLVAVVGDPISLCSVGKCRKLWEKFIYTCHKENSLFGITWDSLRSHLDSMELKKTFILNPLAPEFVPGRTFHGQPNVSNQSNDFMCMQSGPAPQPYVIIPLASQFQGSPIMQPAVQHMVAPPPPPPPAHSYNVGLNCVGPSVMPHTFQGFPCNPPPLPPATTLSLPLPPSLQSRIPSNIFSQRLLNPRFPVEQATTKNKEAERTALIGRPIKRGGLCSIYNSTHKQTIMKSIDERNQNNSNGVEEPRRFLDRNNELHGTFSAITDQVDCVPSFTNIQNNIFCPTDSIPKGNTMKLEENLSIVKQGMQSHTELNHFSSFSESFLQSHLKGNTINGTRFSIPLKNDFDGFPLDMNGLPNMETPLVHQNVNSYSNNEFNSGLMHEKERSIVGSLDGVLFQSDTNNHPQPASYIPAERWSGNIETPIRDLIQSALQEKLLMLEKVLPPGMDLKNFLESPILPSAFCNHLRATEGPHVATKFVSLLMGIKQDQEALTRSYVNSQMTDRSNHLRDMPNGFSCNPMSCPPPSRVANSSATSSRPVHQTELCNGYDPFRYDASVSRCQFNIDKNDPRSLVNGEGRNGLVRLPVHNSAFKQDSFPISNTGDKSKENILLKLRNLSLTSRSENNNPKSSLPVENSFFQNESIPEAVRRAEFERLLKEPQKDPWVPLSQPNNDAMQDSYLNKLRSLSTSATTASENPMKLYEMLHRSPKRMDPEAPAQMTALSVSYPDIPNILSTQVQPNRKEQDPLKAIRKPSIEQPFSENSHCNDTHRPSQYLVDFSVSRNNSTSLQYSQVPSEGMTYAKILRSPNP